MWQFFGINWAYRCRTCANHPNMTLCSQCFNDGNHNGHESERYLSTINGFCDCGNELLMKKEGFCPKHQA